MLSFLNLFYQKFFNLIKNEQQKHQIQDNYLIILFLDIQINKNITIFYTSFYLLGDFSRVSIFLQISKDLLKNYIASEYSYKFQYVIPILQQAIPKLFSK
ncbi:hypothetical protein PPERSA_06615 [Pseudocohnilembus persalinus]|uniref:Uncharacterized protein n=1 Tax=Pseudocohnilembus persalinus TaxID=266149 RepID=A0A0V0QSU3_PSEPJ|nr:hypothetical protein PPERSA_06615 [Pseudocohnilembus persalinus]|eukprot:KRX04981.1 hypothetical protein PPERSA_06615 [Pseudocohnilembus persalinus]